VAFSHAGLHWQKFVVNDPKYYRPTEVDLLVGDYSKAKDRLGWTPKTKFVDLVKLMVDADLQRVQDHLAGRGRVTG
jgi:GDPmannose 4,6-dehydratase